MRFSEINSDATSQILQQRNLNLQILQQIQENEADNLKITIKKEDLKLEDDDECDKKKIEKLVSYSQFVPYFDTLNGILYLLQINNNSNNQVFHLNIDASLLVKYKYVSLIIVKNHVYFCGGKYDDHCYTQTFQFNIDALNVPNTHERLVQKKDMLSPKFLNSLVSKENTIYSIGGRTNEIFCYSCEKYKIRKDKWIPIPNLSNAKAFVTSCLVNCRYLYCFGGNREGFLSHIEVLDTENEQKGWNFIKQLLKISAIPSYSHSIQISKSQVLLFGNYVDISQAQKAHSYLYDFTNRNLSRNCELQSYNSFLQVLTPPVRSQKNEIYAIGDDLNLHSYIPNTNLWSIVKSQNWKK